MTGRTVRLVVVDELERVRVALRALLLSEPDFEVVAEAADEETALRLVAEHHPDMVVVDPALSGVEGPQIITALRSLDPALLIICLTLHCEFRAAATKAGSTLFLDKGICPDTLLAALRQAAAPMIPSPARVFEAASSCASI